MLNSGSYKSNVLLHHTKVQHPQGGKCCLRTGVFWFSLPFTTLGLSVFSLFLSLFCYLTDSSPPSSPPTSQGPSTSTSLGYHPLTSGSIKTTSTLCKLPQWLFNSQVPCWNTYKVFLLFWNTVISLLFWNTSRQNIAKKKVQKSPKDPSHGFFL